MNKIVVIVVVLLLAGAGAFALTQGSNGDKSKDTPSTTKTDDSEDKMTAEEHKSAESSSTDTTATAMSSVTISNFAFNPANITVKKGTKVTWTNQDSVRHDVTSDTTGGPKSELLGQGESYSFTFDTVGTFKYHCTPHPNMMGSVTVTE